MGTRIRILPEELVAKIAAGEVVERPASVVKELVENALDAGATQVEVDIRGGGRAGIQVTDNGSGMSRDDALLCLERHATSKIASTEDLFAIRTLGFRGEALAAIAGVSRFELTTRTPDAESGWRVVAPGGVVRSVEEVGAPVGTSILVKDLFFNTPARLKFMRSVAVETGHIVDLVTRLAMSREGVALRLTRGPELLLQVSGVSQGRDRLVEILGQDQVGHLHPFMAGRGGIRVHGYLGDPSASRSGWEGLYAFVNGRFMRDRLVTRSVGEAYRGAIPKGRYPIAVVNVEVDPQDVDVNVHPGKIEVRFVRPRLVSELISEALATALARAPWQRGALSGPRPEEASSLFPVYSYSVTSALPPVGGEDGDPSVLESLPPVLSAAETPVPRPPAPWAEQTEIVNVPAPLAAPEDDGAERSRVESLAGLEPPVFVRAGMGAEPPRRAMGGGGMRPVLSGGERGAGGSLGQARLEGEGEAGEGVGGGISRDADAGGDGGGTGLAGEGGSGGEGGTGEAGASLVGVVPVPETGRGRPVERSGILPGLEVRNFSRMRVIGQYANCFMLCQDGDELVIIDQHAAHERVTFEQLRASWKGLGARSQQLLNPVMVELPRREAAVLEDHLAQLAELGLEVEPFGGTTYAVKSVPVVLAGEDLGALVTDMAAELSATVARQPLVERTWKILATMACHGSVRANRKMSVPEMEALLKLLDGTDFNFACPHGRPLLSRFSRREVEKLFKRT